MPTLRKAIGVLFLWGFLFVCGGALAEVGDFPTASLGPGGIVPPESGWRAVEARLFTGAVAPNGERLVVLWSAAVSETTKRPSEMGLAAYGRSGGSSGGGNGGGARPWRLIGAARKFSDRTLRFDPKTQGLPGLPPLVIAVDNGGGCLGCDGVMLFGFSDEGVAPVQPDLPSFLFLNGVLAGLKGRPPELEAIDGRWDRFGGLCASCSPAIPIYYAWSNGRLTETCDAHHDVYQEVIDTAGGGDSNGLPLTVFLAALQLRQPIDKALSLFRMALEERRAEIPEFFKQEEARLTSAVRRAASSMASRPCPILSLSPE